MSDDATNAGTAGAGAGGATATATADQPRTYTQEDVDREFGRRLAKEKEKLTKTYGDLEALKTKAEQFDEIQAAGQSELERAQEKLGSLEGEKTQLLSNLQEARLEAAIAAQASDKGLVDVDLAIAALSRSGIKVEFDDNGRPKDIGGVLDDLIEKKPALAGKQRSSGFDGGTRARAGGPVSMDEVIRTRARS